MLLDSPIPPPQKKNIYIFNYSFMSYSSRLENVMLDCDLNVFFLKKKKNLSNKK